MVLRGAAQKVGARRMEDATILSTRRRPCGMVAHDDTVVPIEDLAAESNDGERLDAVTFGLLVVAIRALDLQFPEACHRKQKNRDSHVLKYGHLGRRKAQIVPELNLARLGPLREILVEGREAHV